MTAGTNGTHAFFYESLSYESMPEASLWIYSYGDKTWTKVKVYEHLYVIIVVNIVNYSK